MTHHWEALGWTLIHFCWQAAAIAGVYRLADLAWSKRSSSGSRYLLALAAMLTMLLASLATLAYEETSRTRAAAVPISTQSLKPDTAIVPRTIAVALMPSDKPQATQWLARDIMPYLDGLWLLGVLALSVRTFGGWWIIRRLRSRILEKAPHTLRIRLDRLRLQMKVSRFVDLRLSARIASPITVGVIRPLILLPVAVLTHLSPEQIEGILAHELAHIRRADYFWNILQTMVETLFFFHPAVWWVSRRAREERELCCDDIALATCSNPILYAEALLRLEEQRKTHLHLAMAFDGNQPRTGLRARVLRILGDAAEQPREFKPLSVVGAFAALSLFLCPLPQVFASFREAPKPAPAPAPIHAAIPMPTPPAIALAAPQPAPSPAAAPAPVAAPVLMAESAPEAPQSPDVRPASSGDSNYIDQMKAAGYDVDLDEYIAMKVQGITPEYAREMAKSAAGKPSADELIAMKVQGVSPEYLSKMAAAGYAGDLDKFIAMKVQGITPEYANDMAKAGFGKPGTDDLIAMKVQNVTPEYAAKLRADGIEASNFSDLIAYRIFNVSPEFVAGMKDAGYGSIPAKQLLTLRVQGVTPEYAKSVRQQFPKATIDDLIQMRVMHIDGDFIASAKRHGFEPLTIDKLVKLRISGILNDSNDKVTY